MKFLIGKASTKAGPWRGVMTNWPFGLFWSEAIFARNLLYEIPAEAVRPVTLRISALIISAMVVADEMLSRFWVTSR